PRACFDGTTASLKRVWLRGGAHDHLRWLPAVAAGRMAGDPCDRRFVVLVSAKQPARSTRASRAAERRLPAHGVPGTERRAAIGLRRCAAPAAPVLRTAAG